MEQTKQAPLTHEELDLVRDLYKVLLINSIPLGQYLDTVFDCMNRYIADYKLKPLPPDEVEDKPIIEDEDEEILEDDEYDNGPDARSKLYQ